MVLEVSTVCNTQRQKPGKGRWLGLLFTESRKHKVGAKKLKKTFIVSCNVLPVWTTNFGELTHNLKKGVAYDADADQMMDLFLM